MQFPVTPEVDEAVERLELPFNRYGLDPYGISKTHLKRFGSMLAWLYRHYFDVKVFGIENVPDRGRAMIICNHSGGVALDAAMIITACLLEKEQPRLAQGMADKFLNFIPFSSVWTSRVGQLTGLPEHAARLLEDDRVLLVFPEGANGTAKLYWERHSLVKFGTGFARLALETGTPIIPTAFVGGGEAIPTVYNARRLGRLVGAPYVPFTPWGVALPRPTSLQIYFGEPMVFDASPDEEDEVIQGYVEAVRDRVAAMLQLGVERRRTGTLDTPVVMPGQEGR